MPRLAASLSMLFQECDLLDRFERAAAVGFQGVEVQSPYAASQEDIGDRLRRHRLSPVLFNVEPAIAAVPGRETEFRAALTRALEYAAATGCPQLHCLAGVAGGATAEATFVRNLRWGSQAARPFDVTLLVEPLNTWDNPGYFLTSTRQARRVITEVGCDNVLLQYDCYHMQMMEGRLVETLQANRDILAHVQIGGVPGRHEPDQHQEINYPHLFDILDTIGFSGWVGCEYRPRGATEEGLGWAARYGIGSDRSGR